MAVARRPRRGDVYLIQVQPARGSGKGKTRPGVVVSPDELNMHLASFVVAALATGGRSYPFRVPCRFAGKDGHVVLDQLHTVDEARLVKRLGAITEPTLRKMLGALQQMFAA